MQFSPLAAAAIQLPLLVAATAVLLRAAPGLRWLRVMLLGLVWLLVTELALPAVVASEGPLAGVPLVAAVTVALLLVAFYAAAAELRLARSFLTTGVGAAAVVAACLLLLPEALATGLTWALWVPGALHLGWTFHRNAQHHPGSLLEARLRMLAGAQWLLAAVALSTLGGPFLVVWVLPMAAGTLIMVLAIAPPPFLRLALSQTRAALRETETDMAAIGPEQPGAVRAAVDGVRAVFGAEAALLVDDGEVVAAVGDPATAELGRQWSADPSVTTVSGRQLHPVRGGRWVLAGDTGRGVVVVVLSAVGVLLSATDREQVDAIAERLGLVLTREEARRADERAAASMRAAERMRDDMLSTLSHELRTPLTTIMGFAEVLRRHADTLSEHQVHDMLDRLVDRGMQLEGIVSALLDLTAIRGRSEPERIAVYELRDLVEYAVTRARDGLEDRFVDVTGEGTTVHTDGGAVLAVLGELLENAAKYTPHGSPIRIDLAVDGGEVRVDVCDEGPGLGELAPDAVFAPFLRGGDVLTRQVSGVGIGLAIARELAHQVGGDLVAVACGSGACFRLRLPRRHDLAPSGDDRTPIGAEHALGDPTLVPSGRRGDVPFSVRPASSVGPGAASSVRGSG